MRIMQVEAEADLIPAFLGELQRDDGDERLRDAADVPWHVGVDRPPRPVDRRRAGSDLGDRAAGIDAYMPGLPGADRMTPRQLLQNTTGLAEYINDPAVVNDRRREWTPSELIAVAEAAGRVGEPGEAYHYANTNYIVLGEIIRQVTHNSWSDAVHARIAEPLGLTHTRAMTDERPIGYAYVDGSLVESTLTSSPSIGGAAGAMLSTNRDLLTFAKALTDGTVLSAESQAAMRAFVPGDDYSPFGIVHGYGLGLGAVRDRRDRRRRSHGHRRGTVGVPRLRHRARHDRRGRHERRRRRTAGAHGDRGPHRHPRSPLSQPQPASARTAASLLAASLVLRRQRGHKGRPAGSSIGRIAAPDCRGAGCLAKRSVDRNRR